MAATATANKQKLVGLYVRNTTGEVCVANGVTLVKLCHVQPLFFLGNVWLIELRYLDFFRLL